MTRTCGNSARLWRAAFTSIQMKIERIWKGKGKVYRVAMKTKFRGLKDM